MAYLEQGHARGKVVTIPLAPARAAIDLAVGERSDGPLLLAADGRRLDRHGAARVRRVTCCAGITRPVGPHTLRLRLSPLTTSFDARVPLRDVQEAAPHADGAGHRPHRTSSLPFRAWLHHVNFTELCRRTLHWRSTVIASVALT